MLGCQGQPLLFGDDKGPLEVFEQVTIGATVSLEPAGESLDGLAVVGNHLVRLAGIAKGLEGGGRYAGLELREPDNMRCLKEPFQPLLNPVYVSRNGARRFDVANVVLTWDEMWTRSASA